MQATLEQKRLAVVTTSLQAYAEVTCLPALVLLNVARCTASSDHSAMYPKPSAFAYPPIPSTSGQSGAGGSSSNSHGVALPYGFSTARPPPPPPPQSTPYPQHSSPRPPQAAAAAQADSPPMPLSPRNSDSTSTLRVRLADQYRLERPVRLGAPLPRGTCLRLLEVAQRPPQRRWQCQAEARANAFQPVAPLESPTPAAVTHPAACLHLRGPHPCPPNAGGSLARAAASGGVRRCQRAGPFQL